MSDPRDADLRGLARLLVADAPPPPAFDELDLRRRYDDDVASSTSARPTRRRGLVSVALCLLMAVSMVALSRVQGSSTPALVDAAGDPVPSTLPAAAGQRMALLRSTWDDPRANVVSYVDLSDRPAQLTAPRPEAQATALRNGPCAGLVSCLVDADRSFVGQYEGTGDDGRSHDSLVWVTVYTPDSTIRVRDSYALGPTEGRSATGEPGPIEPTRVEPSSLVLVTIFDAESGDYITNGVLVAIR